MTLVEVIHERGPQTVAAFMDLALYSSEFGYYTRSARRSGRAGDFFTSVDVGPVFGELLERQLAEMISILDRAPHTLSCVDLVEAGAGNGRLSRDLLRTAHARHPDLYRRLRLHLVERSPTACAAHRETLAETAERLVYSGPTLPVSFSGVLIANELLDAMPAHQIVVRGNQLREVYVTAVGGHLTTVEGPPSSPALAAYFDQLGVTLEEGWRAEVNLNAVRWIADVASSLQQGFVIVIDYGHEASELYSLAHASGTLTSFSRHSARGSESGTPAWLERPGNQDLTSHVDFTSVRIAAEDAGLVTLGLLDQTYFLMELLDPEALEEAVPSSAGVRRRLALKTLLLPGGLGSTMKVVVFGKHIGTPRLRGCSGQVRFT